MRWIERRGEHTAPARRREGRDQRRASIGAAADARHEQEVLPCDRSTGALPTRAPSSTRAGSRPHRPSPAGWRGSSDRPSRRRRRTRRSRSSWSRSPTASAAARPRAPSPSSLRRPRLVSREAECLEPCRVAGRGAERKRRGRRSKTSHRSMEVCAPTTDGEPNVVHAIAMAVMVRPIMEIVGMGRLDGRNFEVGAPEDARHGKENLTKRHRQKND